MQGEGLAIAVPFNAGGWFPILRLRLGQALASPRALERLQTLTRHLPGECPMALEFRLRSGEERTDLSIRLITPALARRVADLALPAHIRRFLLDWADEPPPGVPSLWLEFDLEASSPELPVPCVCAEIQRGPDPVDSLWLTGSLLPALHGGPLTAAQKETVARCVSAIRPPARLLYAFSLGSRGAGEVRLEMIGLPPGEMAGWVDRLAPHAAGPLAGIAPLFQDVDRAHLSLDVGEGISGRVGIEGSYARLPHREPRWRGLFDRLVERGLCAPAKAEAALAWPGTDSFWTAGGLWPLNEAALGTRGVRSLSHVKVVAHPDRPPEAKVYLLFTPRPAAKRSGD